MVQGALSQARDTTGRWTEKVAEDCARPQDAIRPKRRGENIEKIGSRSEVHAVDLRSFRVDFVSLTRTALIGQLRG